MAYLTILSHNIWLETGFFIGVLFVVNVFFLRCGNSFMVSSFWIIILEYFNAKKGLTFFQILDLEKSMVDPERLSTLRELGVLLAITFLFSFFNRIAGNDSENEDEESATGTGMNFFSLAFLFTFIDINFFNSAFSAFYFLPFLGTMMYMEDLTVRK